MSYNYIKTSLVKYFKAGETDQARSSLNISPAVPTLLGSHS